MAKRKASRKTGGFSLENMSKKQKLFANSVQLAV